MSVIIHIANGRASYAYAPNDEFTVSVKAYDSGEQHYIKQTGKECEMRGLFVVGKHPDGNDVWKQLVDHKEPLTAEFIRGIIKDNDVTVISVNAASIDFFNKLTHVGTKLTSNVTYNFGDTDTSSKEYYESNLDEYVYDWFLVYSRLPN